MLSALLLASALAAPPALTGTEAQLYAWLRAAQSSSPDPYRSGAWPSTVHFPVLSFDERTAFISLGVLLSLEDVSRHAGLPGFDALAAAAGRQLAAFEADARETSEPAGTLAWWPVVRASGGRKLRTHASWTAPFFHIPGDFDDSALAAAWYALRGQRKDFVEGFARTAGGFRDVERREQAPSDARWKELNSGAFLTWAEPELVPGGRIFTAVNDVDCVVNLNVLAALGAHERAGGRLPFPAWHGKQAACKLVGKAIAEEKTASCAMYYTRSSQFLYAYARAADQPVDCLRSSSAAAAALAVREAAAALSRDARNPTEASELIVALKKLFPPEKRTPQAASAISGLTARLRESISADGAGARVASADSLCTTNFKGTILWWSSPAYGTALALQALVDP